MGKIEKFMLDLFSARIDEEKKILADRAYYRQRFFTPDCRWDSRLGTLTMRESEVIMSISESPLEATVVTAYNVDFLETGLKLHRLRYHLKKADGEWLIKFVEIECVACHGRGDVNCYGCHGKHWLA